MNTTSEAAGARVTHSSFHGSQMEPQRMRCSWTAPFARAIIPSISINWAGSAPLLEIPRPWRRRPDGAGPLIQGGWGPFARGNAGSYYQVTRPDSPVLDLLTSLPAVGPRWWKGLTAVYPSRQRLLSKAGVLPRFFLVQESCPPRSMDRHVLFARAPDFDPAAKPSSKAGASPRVRDSAPPGQGEGLRYEPRTVLTRSGFAGPRIWRLGSRHPPYPGGASSRTGKCPATTQLAFRGLPVPAGRHSS